VLLTVPVTVNLFICLYGSAHHEGVLGSEGTAEVVVISACLVTCEDCRLVHVCQESLRCSLDTAKKIRSALLPGVELRSLRVHVVISPSVQTYSRVHKSRASGCPSRSILCADA
jgi:hypothetical protein